MNVFLVMNCKTHQVYAGFPELEMAQESIRRSFDGLNAIPFFAESIMGKEWLACFSIKGKIVGQLAIRLCEVHPTVVIMKGVEP